MRALWLLGLAGGCHRSHPLSEVPIEGGSDEVHAIVEAELAAFAEAIGPQTVELSQVRFRDLREEIRGKYSPPFQRITLDEALPDEEVAWILRHELCHALDYQVGLAEQEDEALDAYAERLYGPEGGLPMEGTRRLRRSEALASFCELGPTGAAALVHPCTGEDPVLAELAELTLAEVWQGAPERWALPEEPPARFFPLTPFENFSLRPTREPDVLWLDVHTEDKIVSVAVELHTGAPLETVPELLDAEFEGVSAPWASESISPFYKIGGPEQALIVAGLLLDAYPIFSPGSPEERLLWSDGDSWAVVPLCLPERWDFFAAQDQVWYAEADEDQIWWSPVTDGDG